MPLNGDAERGLSGKAALVTGAGTRVGACIARELGARRMRVAVHYHTAKAGAEATRDFIERAGGEAFCLSADLYDRAQVRELAVRVEARFGNLDLLVANAANFDRVHFDAIDEAVWDRALELNLEAPFFLVHHLREALRRARGSVVFITGTGATVPYRHYLPYLVSKGALRHLTKALSLELAPLVRVNAIAPGTVLPPAEMSAEQLRSLVSHIPLARHGAPSDVVEAVLYLAEASFVTGQELVVDGGRTVL